MKEKNTKKYKNLLIGIGIIAIVTTAIYIYYRHNEIYPNTENAYINANLINVAPKVSGYIAHIYVKNNQLLHKGDLLITIDPKDYALLLTKSKQDVILAIQQSKIAKQQITTATANITIAKSACIFANQLAVRYSNLYKQKAGSLQDMQKYTTQATQAKQQLEQANAALQQAKNQYQTALTQIALANTALINAQNNVAYTVLRSPVNGYVSDLNLREGELVQAGQKLFGIVDNSVWWVDANFKETQLKRIKIGQPVTIKLDMYHHTYTGIVQSISHASGNTFALLPAENATGNWVKVTQRFTVRIKIDNDKSFPLRVGASSHVTINTEYNKK